MPMFTGYPNFPASLVQEDGKGRKGPHQIPGLRRIRCGCGYAGGVLEAQRVQERLEGRRVTFWC